MGQGGNDRGFIDDPGASRRSLYGRAVGSLGIVWSTAFRRKGFDKRALPPEGGTPNSSDKRALPPEGGTPNSSVGHWRARMVVRGARHHRRSDFHQTQLAFQLADDGDDLRRRRIVRLPGQAARNRGLVPAPPFFLRIVSPAQTSSALHAHYLFPAPLHSAHDPASLRIARLGGLPALPRGDLAGDRSDHAERLERAVEALCGRPSLPQDGGRGIDYRDLRLHKFRLRRRRRMVARCASHHARPYVVTIATGQTADLAPDLVRALFVHPVRPRPVGESELHARPRI